MRKFDTHENRKEPRNIKVDSGLRFRAKPAQTGSTKSVLYLESGKCTNHFKNVLNAKNKQGLSIIIIRYK